MTNSRQAIKHIELMSEQIQALEQQNTKLKEQLNTAICLLCSNKANVVQYVEALYDREGSYGKQTGSRTTYALFVEALNGSDSGSFSPESTPYQAVLTGIDEYIDYMPDNNAQTHALFQ